MPDELMTKAEVDAIAVDKREFPSIVRLARTALHWQAEAERLATEAIEVHSTSGKYRSKFTRDSAQSVLGFVMDELERLTADNENHQKARLALAIESTDRAAENERLQAKLDTVTTPVPNMAEYERLQRKRAAACEEGKRLRGARSCPFDCPLGLDRM